MKRCARTAHAADSYLPQTESGFGVRVANLTRKRVGVALTLLFCAPPPEQALFFLDGLGVNRDAIDLRELFLDAVFERGRHIVHLRNG